MNIKLCHRYAQIASRWDTPAFSNIRRDDLLPRLLTAADLMDRQSILEAMCGTGGCLRAVQQRHPQTHLTALDFSRQMLEHAPQSARKVCRSVLSMPFAASSFDRIFLRNGLYDLPATQQLPALRAIRRVIKPDGIFILQTYYTEPATHATLNWLTNAKDMAAGQYQPGADGLPRYFATLAELRSMFRATGWRGREVCRFTSQITYSQSGEMFAEHLAWWVRFASTFPPTILRRIRWQPNSKKGPQFSFPGVVYVLHPYRA